jgi:hypothetical protein
MTQKRSPVIVAKIAKRECRVFEVPIQAYQRVRLPASFCHNRLTRIVHLSAGEGEKA